MVPEITYPCLKCGFPLGKVLRDNGFKIHPRKCPKRKFKSWGLGVGNFIPKGFKDCKPFGGGHKFVFGKKRVSFRDMMIGNTRKPKKIG